LIYSRSCDEPLVSYDHLELQEELDMAHRRLNRPESNFCIPYEKMNSFQKLCHDQKVSGIMGLLRLSLIKNEQDKENKEKLIAAGFLIPCVTVNKPPKKNERLSFSQWIQRYETDHKP
jgi:hypothetical protein